ncbi:hypothetical protein E4582_09860 [Luteimonas yindakuii]|uniref:Uncharacterized protein n=1 Tax=Luteimonas yindakuii TaxID=2565782 RepID=A0A4Z1R8V8_9GAMM|nr:hypothetical protein [Luteimonas yindakuii]TKS55035.1 hypothetical protein E4582_09860 [Luteimonas yindakuii]
MHTYNTSGSKRQLVQLDGQHILFHRVEDGRMVYDPMAAGILDRHGIECLRERNWFTAVHEAQLLALVARRPELMSKGRAL